MNASLLSGAEGGAPYAPTDESITRKTDAEANTGILEILATPGSLGFGLGALEHPMKAE
jgi:hypothetical protein